MDDVRSILRRCVKLNMQMKAIEETAKSGDVAYRDITYEVLDKDEIWRQLCAVRCELFDLIKATKDFTPLEIKVVRERYIRGREWSDIIRLVRKARSHVYRIHKSAVEKIARANNGQ